MYRPQHTMTRLWEFRNARFLSRMKCFLWSIIPDFDNFVPIVIIRHTANSAVCFASLCQKYFLSSFLMNATHFPWFSHTNIIIKSLFAWFFQDYFFAVAQTFSRWTSCCEGTGYVPGKSMWDLSWSNWNWGSFFPEFFDCSRQYYSTITSYFTTFMYLQRYINLASNSVFK